MERFQDEVLEQYNEFYAENGYTLKEKAKLCALQL